MTVVSLDEYREKNDTTTYEEAIEILTNLGNP